MANGTTRSRTCVYFAEARTNLEVDAPLICLHHQIRLATTNALFTKKTPSLLVKYPHPSIGQVSPCILPTCQGPRASIRLLASRRIAFIFVSQPHGESWACWVPIIIPHLFSHVRCLWHLIGKILKFLWDITVSCLKPLVYGISSTTYIVFVTPERIKTKKSQC